MSKRKNPAEQDNLNAEFCDFLMELADYEKNVSRNIHKYNAYRKAASVLASHPKKIESGEEAKKLSGIGDKISKKIDEFIHTGKLRKLENIHNDEEVTAINLMTSVSGIGPVKAKELVKSGIKSIEDLQNIKEKLTHHQQIGLKYHKDFQKKIPRVEIQKLEDELKKCIFELDKEYNITICGSYRRGKSESGDIDVLLTHPSVQSTAKDHKVTGKNLLGAVVDKLTREDIVTDVISLGDTKFMVCLGDNDASLKVHFRGVCRLKADLPSRRLDIRFTPHDQYYCAILYFTGSDMFNKTMRAHAQEHGFTLNEYCLRPLGETGVPGEPVPVSSEEDIFDYIDYPYKKPDGRNM